jgi:putative membrane protein
MPRLIAYLPALNAALNAASAILLATGYLFIQQRRVRGHKRCMLSAFVISCVFLVSYLTLRYYAGMTRFTGQGWIRPVYFSVLISHTILAVVIVPLALITVSWGLAGRYDRHVRIARWTLPLWLYVSVTGVLVYWMLFQLYPHG